MVAYTYDNYTDEELERIDWFRNAGPCLREEMIMTYEIICRTAEDDGITSLREMVFRVRGEYGIYTNDHLNNGVNFTLLA